MNKSYQTKIHSVVTSDRDARSKIVQLAMLVLLALFGLPSAVFADATWIGGTSQNWNTGANWSANPPTGSFFINTNAAGVYPIISANSAFTPVDIIIGDGVVGGASNTGRVDQTTGSLATGSGNWLMVGRNGMGTYNLTGGTLTAGGIHIARTTGTAGRRVRPEVPRASCLRVCHASQGPRGTWQLRRNPRGNPLPIDVRKAAHAG